MFVNTKIRVFAKLPNDDGDEFFWKNNEPYERYTIKWKSGVESVSPRLHFFSDCSAMNILKIIFSTALCCLAYLLFNAVSKLISSVSIYTAVNILEKPLSWGDLGRHFRGDIGHNRYFRWGMRCLKLGIDYNSIVNSSMLLPLFHFSSILSHFTHTHNN